jgi:hypothetical protein
MKRSRRNVQHDTHRSRKGECNSKDSDDTAAFLASLDSDNALSDEVRRKIRKRVEDHLRDEEHYRNASTDRAKPIGKPAPRAVRASVDPLADLPANLACLALGFGWIVLCDYWVAMDLHPNTIKAFFRLHNLQFPSYFLYTGFSIFFQISLSFAIIVRSFARYIRKSNRTTIEPFSFFLQPISRFILPALSIYLTWCLGIFAGFLLDGLVITPVFMSILEGDRDYVRDVLSHWRPYSLYASFIYFSVLFYLSSIIINRISKSRRFISFLGRFFIFLNFQFRPSYWRVLTTAQ